MRVSVMKIGITFIGFLLFITGLCLAVASIGSVFLTEGFNLFICFSALAIIGLWSGIAILRKCATLPMSDQRVHISHKLAR